MKKFLTVALTLALLPSLMCSGAAEAERKSSPQPGWKLVWADEFDYIGEPDPESWRADVGGGGWGNAELQYYTASGNARVNGRSLEIVLRAEPMGGNAYTSAKLVSTRGWKYGRFEVSARLPKGTGTWPAVWMMPTVADPELPWPHCGELDIMENVGFDHGNIHQTVHTGAYNGMNGGQKGGTKRVRGVSEAFHVYALEWLPGELKFFTDGEQVFRYDPGEYTDTVTAAEWPFGEYPFSLILNVAYGGSWGGAMGTDDTSLPATMEIDYVRVYELERLAS